MRDLILFISLLAGTYLCSMGFALVVFKLFFPLKKKEEVSTNTLTLTYSKNKMPLSSYKNKMHVMSVNGREGGKK